MIDARDPGIEHHRHLLGRDLARIEAPHRALAGALAERRRGFEIAEEDGRGIVVVALHAGAFAGQHRDAQARMALLA